MKLHVCVDSPEHTDHCTVEGFAGLIEKILIADGIGHDDPANYGKSTIFIARTIVPLLPRDDGEVKAVIRLWQDSDGNGAVQCLYLSGVEGFENELITAGLTVYGPAHAFQIGKPQVIT